MKYPVVLLVAAFSMTLSLLSALAEERYPIRLPDWLWNDDPRYSVLMSEEDRLKVISILSQADLLEAQKKSSEAEAAYKAARDLLHANYSVRDLIRGARVVHDPATGRTIAVQLDPLFGPEMSGILIDALTVYLKFATDEDVVSKAYASSIDTPQPLPTEKSDDGTLNGLFVNYLQSIQKPIDPKTFIEELSLALSRHNQNIPLLVISSYRGGPWWGGGLYDAYRSPEFALKRTGAENFFYIRLNLDRMTPQSANVSEPAFWASKIAHELLHNLGYWHPSYKSPEERDSYNEGNERAFIVAYETFLLEAARKKP